MQYAKHLGLSEHTTLARTTKGMSGRDLRAVCESAERRWASEVRCLPACLWQHHAVRLELVPHHCLVPALLNNSLSLLPQRQQQQQACMYGVFSPLAALPLLVRCRSSGDMWRRAPCLPSSVTCQ